MEYNSKVTFCNSFRNCNVNNHGGESTVYQLPFQMLQILKLCLCLWESNIILGFGYPYVIGLAFNKTVSILAYFKEEHNQTLNKIKGHHELCLQGVILSELNWSEIKALFLEKKAMI